MSAPLPVLTPHRRSRLPLWIGLGVLALVLTVLGTAGYLASVGIRVAGGWQAAANTLPAEEEKAIEQGLPLEPEDLRPIPAVPPGKNAALLYRRIDALYRQDSETGRKSEGAAVSAFMKPETRDQRKKPQALQSVILAVLGSSESGSRPISLDASSPLGSR